MRCSGRPPRCALRAAVSLTTSPMSLPSSPCADPISALRPSTSTQGYLDPSRHDSKPPSPDPRSPVSPKPRRGALKRAHSTRTDRKIHRFRKALAAEREINMQELKGLAWNGVPDELRPIVWQLLLVRPSPSWSLAHLAAVPARQD